MIDLHTHSLFSDGSESPAQLVARAEAVGLSAIALTDHNTVAGLDEFMEAGARSPVETVPGAELTAQHHGTELHILALYISPAQYGAVTAWLEQFRLAKERSNRRLIDALARAGIHIDYDRICAEAGDYVNRADIAREMTRKGYTQSVKAAFHDYLQPGQGFYIPPQRHDALETVRFIRSIGAVPVLAHPLVSMTGEALRVFLPLAAEAGLAAMETYYTEYDAPMTCLAFSLAEEFGLLPSGGSDYHGAAKPDITMGTGWGDLQIPDSVLGTLKNERNRTT